jgi:hypothetical protein
MVSMNDVVRLSSSEFLKQPERYQGPNRPS